MAQAKGKRKAKGVRLLYEYQNGAKLTLKKGVLAKCADCTAEYADGMFDCEVPTCPLYPWMPYRRKCYEPKDSDT